MKKKKKIERANGSVTLQVKKMQFEVFSIIISGAGLPARWRIEQSLFSELVQVSPKVSLK